MVKSATNLQLLLQQCEKVNTTGTDENLFRLSFRLVSVSRHGAQVVPLELVPVPRDGAQMQFVPGHQQKAMLRLVHRVRAPSLNRASNTTSNANLLLHQPVQLII